MLNPHQTVVSLDLREGAFGTKMNNTLKVSQPRGGRARRELELSELDDPSSWSSTSLETSSIQLGSHLAKKEKPCRFYDFRNMKQDLQCDLSGWVTAPRKDFYLIINKQPISSRHIRGLQSHSTFALSPDLQELKVWCKGTHDRQFISANDFLTSIREMVTSAFLSFFFS